MTNVLARTFLVFALSGVIMHAEVRPARLNDTPPPPYTLPDPLVMEDGRRVRDVEEWRARRAELLELFAREVYGRTPIGRPEGMRAEVISVERNAVGGGATRKEVRIRFGAEADAPEMNVLIYVPNRNEGGKVPAFLGLNFYGNHTVQPDEGIALSTAWIPEQATGVVNHRATEAARGSSAARWAVGEIVRRGYAVVTVYCGELCPDRADGLSEAVNRWAGGADTETRAGDAWGAIGLWAWGLSRALDYLETDPDVDPTRVAVHGHSRLGKAALWAAAQDERFALAISNESGCGGAALSKRVHGETVAKINARFPHWFAKNFRRYDEREAALPVDQHQLLALIAPRPLHVASAEEDDWADPRGEFLAVKGAEPVYRMFGFGGPETDDVPPLHSPTGDALRYHIRGGKHDITDHDWSAFLDFADRWLKTSR